MLITTVSHHRTARNTVIYARTHSHTHTHATLFADVRRLAAASLEDDVGSARRAETPQTAVDAPGCT